MDMVKMKDMAQTIELSVTEKGFEPSTVNVMLGTNVILKVTRKTDSTCATQIQIPSKKIKQELPLNKAVSIEVGRLEKGEIRFGCGMNMMEDAIKKDKNFKSIDGFDLDKAKIEPVDNNRLVEEVGLAIQNLPGSQKIAMQMRYVEEKTFNEIAESLKTTPTNVRQIISRGIKRLKELIHEGDFLNTDNGQVPDNLNEAILAKIQKLIKPSAWMVFLKLLSVHAVMGFLSLSICHQFGLNPFNTDYSLADWFMKVGGHHFCMLGCGILFVAVSIFATGYFLTVEEVKALKRTEFLQNLSIGLISLGLFAAFGVEMILSIAGLWLLGALIGGFVATTAVYKIKGRWLASENQLEIELE
ncbi:unnamed protein product [Rotaria magnacalcarata]|uniref:Uncharacterized protein n=1 Tax=Rotaria magnacalcarata TaxID=392030 RepID=A0A820ENI6_9BILA|nr:unnamed protein product [Rotaria magnacalcarata]